ncbi:hypothetical protein MCUN1_003703 [Malassezia cuniculi]|uniref:Nucleolar pre-ribosomal-associated protein 1 n=1 Tax=Malassezia cuniculi TaxID=948313 RepID=A0AAF0ETK2_9BASI|nr:hypothetical protein MCUN1_003703 [Malassezia cuniculi]
MAAPRADDVAAQLASSSADTVASALTRVRKYTHITAEDIGASGEVAIALGDARLAFAAELIEKDGGRLIFDAWERAEAQSLDALKPLALFVLAQLLVLLGAHQPFHALGEQIIERMFASDAPWMERTLAYVASAAKRDGTPEASVILSALRLLTACASFGRGKHAAATFERVHWNASVSTRLLNMRRRGRRGTPAPQVSLHDADIRLQYISLQLAMLTQSFSSALKVSLVELGSDFLPAVLRGLVADSPIIVQWVLLVLYEDLMRDDAVSRTAKVRFMNEASCAAVVKLYAREDAAEGSPVVADVAHHFMLSICTHPGFGICYADDGWYAKEGDAPLYNKILSGVVKQLSIEDLRQQELLLRILESCPELVAPTLSHTSKKLAIEPHATSTWLANVAFFGRTLALAIPAMHSLPPPIAVILGNTAPDAILRAASKGLQHQDALVRYFSCALCIRCLERMAKFAHVAVEHAEKQEESADGPWTATARAAELEWRRRVPPAETVVALVSATQSAKETMLHEAALRLVALYHEALPSMVLDTRFDAGRLLVRAFLDTTEPRGLRLSRLAQVHALRILALQPVAHFDWSARIAENCASTRKSYIHFLLTIYVSAKHASHDAVCVAAEQLLARWLEAIVNSAELHAWLDALPPAPFDTPPSVLSLIDDCVLRCAKTPYRYLERARELAQGDTPPSPLALAFAEQLAIRIDKHILSQDESGDAARFLAQLAPRLVTLGVPVTAVEQLVSPINSQTLKHEVSALANGGHGASGDDISAIVHSKCDDYSGVLNTPHVDVLVSVILARARPDADPQSAWDAVDQAAKRLSAAQVDSCILQHPSTRAWIGRADKRADKYLARCARCVASLLDPANDDHKTMVAPIVGAIAARLAPSLYAAAIALAPFAGGAAAQLTRACFTQNDPGRLGVIRSLAGHPGAAPIITENAPQLAPLLAGPTRDGVLEVYEALLVSALPPLLDGITEPQSQGSLKRLGMLPRFDVHALLESTWDERLDRVLCRVVYAQPKAISQVIDAWTRLPVSKLPLTLCAVLELAADSLPGALAEAAAKYAAEAICAGENAAASLAGAALPAFTARHLTAALSKSSPRAIFTAPMVWLIYKLGNAELTTQYASEILPWIVRRFAEDAVLDPTTRGAVQAFCCIVRRMNVPAHLADLVVSAAVSHKSDDIDALRLAAALARSLGTGANRHASALLASQHISSARSGSLRDAFVELLTALLRRAPEALDSASALTRVIYLYGGTTSRADKLLSSLFHITEVHSGRSVTGMLGAWSAEQGAVPQPGGALLSAVLTLRPGAAHDSAACAGGIPRDDAYLPRFVLDLLAGAIVERDIERSPPLTGLEWLAVARTGALGVAITCLSSPDACLRAEALVLLGKVHASMRETTFRERDHLLMVLDRVREAIPPPPVTNITGMHDSPPWLPAPATLFAHECIRAICAPHSPAFPICMRFLLQRPKLDAFDMPLLYSMLYSSSDEAQFERVWMLQFLRMCVAAHGRLPDESEERIAEWRIYRRRHVWDLLLSMYDGLAESKRRERHVLEDIFLAAAGVPSIMCELVSRKGYLEWLEMRTARVRDADAAAFWVSLLARMCNAQDGPGAVATVAKLDAAAHGTLVATLLSAACAAVERAQETLTGLVDSAVALLAALAEYRALRGACQYSATELGAATCLIKLVLPHVQATQAPRLLDAVLALATDPSSRALASAFAAVSTLAVLHRNSRARTLALGVLRT